MLSRHWLSALGCIAVTMASAVEAPAETKKPEETTCTKKLSITGFPHRLKTVAELNAVRAWTIQSEKKRGAEYAAWHNARGSQLSCETLSRSVFIRCTATARPCLPRKTTSVEQ